MTKINKEILAKNQIIMPTPMNVDQVKVKLQKIAEGFSKLANSKLKEVNELLAPNDTDQETVALAEHLADVQQEWLPGYATLLPDDGQARITHTYRENGEWSHPWVRVDQRFTVESGETTRVYQTRVWVRRVA